MGSYRRHVLALLRRNLIYRKRTPISSFIQLILPGLTIFILVAIRISLKDSATFQPTTIPASKPETSWRPFSFLDYVTAMSGEKTCVAIPSSVKAADVFSLDFDLRGMEYFIQTNVSVINVKDWQVPFLKCDARECDSENDNATAVNSYCSYNILALAGDKDMTSSFKEWVETEYPQLSSIEEMAGEGFEMIKIFDSEDAIDEYVVDPAYGYSIDVPKIALGVVLNRDGNKYDYTIRTNSTNFNSLELGGRPGMATQPSTKVLFDNLARDANSVCTPEGGTSKTGKHENHCTAQYIYNGAITIQRLVDDWIIVDSGAKDAGYFVAENGVSFTDFPSREYVKDGFYAQIASYAPLLIILGLLFPFASSCRLISAEKELRQKELMKMMSISESAIEVSWFFTLYGFFFFSGIFTTIASKMLYTNASTFLLFILWQIAFVGITNFALFVGSIISRASRATLVGILLFFSGYILTLMSDYATGSIALINLASLHPVAALCYALQIIGSLEDAGVGLQGSTVNFSDNPSGFTFLLALIQLIRCAFLWGFYAFYCNRVVKGDYGQTLPWYFLFTKSYWCGSKVSAEDDSLWEERETTPGVPMEPVSNVLKEQENQGMGVHIRGLTKKFGEKTAVDDLALSMYEGQVFALLGHNGAGKTTTISMLTGMIAPTNGYAIIDGKNIKTEMSAIRENVGICLQHDCLFPQLTVLEHLRFFSRVKGLYEAKSDEDAEASIQSVISDVALSEKRNTFSKDLSGGMKRKLSLAIAFCGDSKIVFLDEPTSGMDPFSRRFTWNVIRQNKEDRCIVLTTHFMDEADLLGDRIGIMAEGGLRCVGSPLFLKKEYGVGYQITIEKNPDASENVTDVVTKIVRSSVPSASVLSNVSSEITFQVPIKASETFPDMFDKLDEKVARKDINMYGVGITTLDEVFLMVARGESKKNKPSLKSSMKLDHGLNDASAASSFRSADNLDDRALFASHVKSLLSKRATNFKRDKKAQCCSTVLPVLFALLGFINVAFIAPDRNMTPLSLSLNDYNPEILEGEKRNPIPFNTANSFNCQPGACIGSPTEMSGSFPFCGQLTNLTGTCTQVEDFSDWEDDESGGVTITSDVSTVGEASETLHKNFENDPYSYSASQYGAIYFTHDSGSIIEETSTDYLTEVASLCENNGIDEWEGFDCDRFKGIGFVVDTNFTALHGSLLYQSIADEAIIREALGDDSFGISATIHPLPLTDVENSFSQAEDSFSAWFYLVLSFPFIAGTFATFVVQERNSKAKHLQTVAGVKPSAYWLSTYLWDVVNYQLPLWFIVILMFAFGINSFTTTDHDIRSGTILTLFFFGPAAAGFSYIITFFFKSPSSCNMFVIVFNFFIGLVGSLVSLILRLIHSGEVLLGNESNLKTIAIAIEWVLRFVPSFNFAKALLFGINVDIFAIVYARGDDISYFSKDIAGYEFAFLVAQSILYPLIAIWMDILSTNPSFVQMFSFQKCRRNKTYEQVPMEEDEDVIAENNRIGEGNANDDRIVISELKKQYPNGKFAVNGLSLGIPSGQVFGLLGINGAGKTTTMAMLTAEFPPTSGDATLAGFSVTSQPEETRRRIGYCPQFDAHFSNMTGTEHVRLYAAIKGVPPELIEEAVKSKLDEVGLNEFDSNQLSSIYSGGMKRKLSVACATIGNPEIVFLDEPSTGMDPVSRRDLWGVISNMVSGEQGKTSVILTTHSMEECEALCPRIGIMATGKLRCLGSAQHLKSRFGKGYQVELKVNEPSEDDSDLKENLVRLLVSVGKNVPNDENVEDGIRGHDIFFDQEDTRNAVEALSGDSYIADKINHEDPSGYLIMRNAESSLGVAADELAAFCTTELRLKKVLSFFEENHVDAILRERQDTRLRFEIPSEGLQISALFGAIEKGKEFLNLSDYGISQTTLEQVFNMFAATAELEKQAKVD